MNIAEPWSPHLYNEKFELDIPAQLSLPKSFPSVSLSAVQFIIQHFKRSSQDSEGPRINDLRMAPKAPHDPTQVSAMDGWLGLYLMLETQS